MIDGRVGSRFGASTAAALLLAACGRTGLNGLSSDGSGGVSGNRGGSDANGAAGATSLGGSSAGGSNTSGTSGAPMGGGGGTGPDFDFTIVPDQAVAYQIDPAHTGAQLATRIEPPLRELWRVEFDGAPSYPIVADSRVFVSVGFAVLAFDASTGAMLWQSEPISDDSIQPAVRLAYDRGALFAANRSGGVVAFESTDGEVRWRKQISEIHSEGTMPIAAGGAVFLSGYATSFPTLYALDERDGSLIYSETSRWGHPTLGGGLIYSTSGCHETKAHDPRDGTLVWHHTEGCFGGGGGICVFHNGLVFTGDSTDGIAALDARTGDSISTFDDESPRFLVSVAGDDVLSQSLVPPGYMLKAWDPLDGSLRWSITLPADPTLPLLLTPGYAWALLDDRSDDRYLFAIDLEKREVVWQSAEPTVPNDPDWESGSSGQGGPQAIAAGAGRIVVSNRGTLAVYVSDDRPECGNRFVEDGEACDDGNTEDRDYCSAACDEVTGRCGDGVIQSNESCDGLPTPHGTSCNDECQITFDGVMLAAGRSHTCGLRQNGTVSCWGSRRYSDDFPAGNYRYISAYQFLAGGVLDDGSAVFGGPFAPDPDNGPFVKLEVARDAYCALRPNGGLFCEGLTIPSPDREYVEIAAADDDVCAITRAGELFCFFEGTASQWGGKYRGVSFAQSSRVCAIRADRTLSCRNDLAHPTGEFIAVTGGDRFWCGIRPGGNLTCWGEHLGFRDNEALLVPPPGQFAVIDAGWQHVCAVRIDGITLCWGDNGSDQSSPPSDFP